MKMLSLQDIASADDLPSKTIEVPEWGGSVKVRMLTKGEQTKVRTMATRDGVLDEELLELGILIEALVEPKVDENAVAILRGKNADVVDRVLIEIFRMNALDKEAVARAAESFPDGLDEVDGVPPGEGAAHDGAATPPGNVLV